MNPKSKRSMQAPIEIRGLSGRIFDLCGGGEGVLGRIYGPDVTAIDLRIDELIEAPDGPAKLVMDAAALAIEDQAFDCVTAFYGFMFIEKAAHSAVFREAFRVLKPGGRLHIWDTEIDRADDRPFFTDVAARVNSQILHATYGIQKDNAWQNAAYFSQLAAEAGFHQVIAEQNAGHFHLEFRKRL